MYLNKLSKYSKVVLNNQRNFSQILKAFATVDPKNLDSHSHGYNLVNGQWRNTEKIKEIVDPLTGKVMLTQPDT